ncbi:hypothetical protein B0T18DRAFT_395579 [Schizothecium vesticola]|uniref:F-box domain-containing protein n=1 Tax=Schizothecium vesticola TaxID=314040 RepID=A0AA40KBL7_9PEZI|nr:hypothetical protein B0T18DRAFT_395579 [Schizothecium vesticola]
MTTLLSLPTEILQDILEELPGSSISSFCQTCKDALHLGERLLYRAISWRFSEPLGAAHPIHAFMRAISRRPALALHVRTAELLSGIDAWGWDDELPDCPAPLDVQELWMECLGRPQIPLFMTDRFEADILGGIPAALVGLLLSALPALETLVTDYTMMQGSHLPGVIFEHNNSKLKLKNMAIRNNLDSRIIKPSDPPWVQAVFCVPSLEHLCTVLPRVSEDQITGATLPSLRSLKLVDHLTEPEAISTLLSKAPKLESLTYFLIEDTDSLAADAHYEDSHQNEWAAFAEALSHVADSLKILKISIDEAATSDYPPDTMDEEWMMGISQRRGRIPSLQHLVHLAKLEIPTYLLLGFSAEHRTPLSTILPPSLRKLYLRDDHVYDDDLAGATPEDVVSMISSYFLDRSSTGVTGPLQELRIKLRGRGITDRFDNAHIKAIAELASPQYLRVLERLGRKAGVKMTIHRTKTTYMLAEHDVVDGVDEWVLYDPHTALGAEISETGELEGGGETGDYPSRRRLKRARVFYSNT